MKPLLIAHRGDQLNFAENTIEAFASAFEKGADGVELDIRFYNGQLVVQHDYYFNQDQPLLTLSEVLKTFSTKGRLEIEVKEFTLDFLIPLKEILRHYQNCDIELTTSNFTLLSALRQTFPQTSVGVIFPGNYFEAWMQDDFITESVLGVMNVTKANVAHVPVIFASLVKAVHRQGSKFHKHIPLSSLDVELQRYQEAVMWSVDQCTFDDINLLKQI